MKAVRMGRGLGESHLGVILRPKASHALAPSGRLAHGHPELH